MSAPAVGRSRNAHAAAGVAGGEARGEERHASQDVAVRRVDRPGGAGRHGRAGSARARPGRGRASAAGTFVGRVQGTEAYIALTYDGVRLEAYACDGSGRRPATISAWFESAWDGDGPVTVVNGGARLRARHVDGQISGRLDGRRFTAVRATGTAGLYERDGRRSVVLADGSVRGTFVSPRPIKCRPVQTTLVDGTTQVVTVCRPV